VKRFLVPTFTILAVLTFGACEDLSFRDHLNRIVNGQIARIAYHAGESKIEEIYLMDSDGSHSLQLTDNLSEDLYPDWSPDGTRIAFSSDRSSSSDAAIDIFVMDADGSNVVRITTSSSGGDYNFRPEWSPDGTRIAYTRYASGGDQDIYVIGLSESGIGSNITDYFGEMDGNPAWKPDGSAIVFMSRHDTGYWQIYRVAVKDPLSSIDVSDVTRMTNQPSPIKDQDPVWSPDGESIVFYSNRGPGDTNEIYLIDAEAENGVPPEIRLTDNTADDKSPEWSPDGSKIIFVSDRSGNFDIYTMNPDGTHQVRLTDTIANDNCPDWR